ncbi:MAG TPA: helix-turn-helix domain-containing protein [Chthoniobacterales bacterium]|jgi:AraC-like DNA-binding protein|nr:helix-turn-helix domain-containing protein [Chthoniobacterales bacterium]
MQLNEELIRRIRESQTFIEYESAFEDATGLPLTIGPVQWCTLPHRARRNENPFCALLAGSNGACAACLEVQRELMDAAGCYPATVTCFAGLCDSVVPIKVGDRKVGFLLTGQVALREPSRAAFKKIRDKLTEWGAEVDASRLEEAYFSTKVVTQRRHDAVVQLLNIFASQLSIIANRMTVQEADSEPPIVRRAKAHITAHYGDAISLAETARAMHVSTFYFCKIFKKATGLTFTDYLGRVRIEKAKNLLLNPHLRISEIAYTVGFQSLTHFNRVFRKLTGEAPTVFRDSLLRV